MDSEKHHWSGWPGGFCLKCGADHALEYAIGQGWYDPFEDKWNCSQKQREEIEQADSICFGVPRINQGGL